MPLNTVFPSAFTLTHDSSLALIMTENNRSGAGEAAAETGGCTSAVAFDAFGAGACAGAEAGEPSELESGVAAGGLGEGERLGLDMLADADS